MEIRTLDLVLALADAVDLVTSVVAHHHKQVSYATGELAGALGMSLAEQQQAVLAGLLHDIGALSLSERLETLAFETQATYIHAERGYRLLSLFPPFSPAGAIIRFHHTPWGNGRGEIVNDHQVPILSHLLHLADRIVVLINKEEEILGQVDKIAKSIKGEGGVKFHPRLVEKFLELTDKEYFWFDLISSNLSDLLVRRVQTPKEILDINELKQLSRLISHVIDFRSHFTATHSAGVAATAVSLTYLNGETEEKCRQMEIAGYIHDLGKLAIPAEVLEKPGRLTLHEVNIMKQHPYYSLRILERVKGLEEITLWGALHHERLDGNGYPFHYSRDELAWEAKAMAVADVFTALSEDRPYRRKMEACGVVSILENMGAKGALDGEIVRMLVQNYERVDQARASAQKEADAVYRKFKES